MLTLIWLLAIIQTAPDTAADAAAPEAPRLSQTYDQEGVERCRRPGYTADVSARFVGARVYVECHVGADGSPERCEVLNPTRAAMRHEAVFLCMASNLRWSYSDGSSTEGLVVRTNLDVRGMW